jgi:S-adenosylmethionine synthetase
VVSTQHAPNVDQETIRRFVRQEIVEPVLGDEYVSDEIKYHINPTGVFEIGGPHGDCGLTGRKIIVDTYGGYARHGGGAFSGKDVTKVDRSAAYAARHAAKNVVAAGLASRCEVQVAYAIGRAEPFSVLVEAFGTAQIDPFKLSTLVWEFFDFRPQAIIDRLDLRRPIYQETAAYGHFGRPQFPWESTRAADELAAAAAAL